MVTLNLNMKALALLSIVVPVTVFFGLRFAGVLPDPRWIDIQETITLETLEWKFEKPDYDVHLEKDIKSTYMEGNASYIQVNLLFYYEKEFLYLGNSLGIHVNVSTYFIEGWVETVDLNFTGDTSKNLVDIEQEYHDFYLKNLKLTGCYDFGKKRGVLASANFLNENRSCSTALILVAHWILLGPNDLTHQIAITVKVVYFNGTMHKEVIQPFTLSLYRDDNNSLEKAEEIEEGTHEAWVSTFKDYDPVDYYKFWTEQGEEIQISILRGTGEPLNISLYRSDETLVMEKFFGNEDIYWERANLTFIVDQTGWWYIKIHPPLSWGESRQHYFFKLEK